MFESFPRLFRAPQGQDGEKKWTSYMFTKSVYNIWMPGHLKRICSVIDTLSLNIIEAWQQSELGKSVLSHGLESHNLSSLDVASLVGDGDSQSSDTSLSQRVGGAVKKLKKRGCR